MATQQIYALFQDVADAERAIGALQDHGVSRDHIGVVARRPAEQNETGHVRNDFSRVTTGEGVAEGEPVVTYDVQPGALPASTIAQTVTPQTSVDTSENVATVGKLGITTTTPQDAAVGASAGAGIGLVAGLLAAAAAIAVPGFGLILGGGALAAALGAAAATTAAGAVAGGVTGYLRDMGMPEAAATSVADRLSEGDYLVTITADTMQYDTLKQLLIKYNAVGVDVTVNEAGQQLLDTWGNDPVQVERLHQVPMQPLPTAVITEPAAVIVETPTAAHVYALDGEVIEHDPTLR